MLRNDCCITKEGIEKKHYEVLIDLGFNVVSADKAVKGPYSVGICPDGSYLVSYYGDFEIHEDFQSCYDFIMKYASMYPEEFNFSWKVTK